MRTRKIATERGPTFIPCTREVSIGDSVVYRPVRMWHSGTYGGEGYTMVGKDGSGCIDDNGYMRAPLTVVTRLYWNVNRPEDTVSAFLSYPNGMSIQDEYFWEVLGTRADGDIERFFGDDAEAKMEEAIRMVLGQSARGMAAAKEAQQARDAAPAKAAEAKERIRCRAEQLRAGKTLEQILAEEDEDPFVLN